HTAQDGKISPCNRVASWASRCPLCSTRYTPEIGTACDGLYACSAMPLLSGEPIKIVTRLKAAVPEIEGSLWISYLEAQRGSAAQPWFTSEPTRSPITTR